MFALSREALLGYSSFEKTFADFFWLTKTVILILQGWEQFTLQTIDERHWDTTNWHWIRLTQLLLLPPLLLLLPIPTAFLALLSIESLLHKKKRISTLAQQEMTVVLTSLPVTLSPAIWELDFMLYNNNKIGK